MISFVHNVFVSLLCGGSSSSMSTGESAGSGLVEGFLYTKVLDRLISEIHMYLYLYYIQNHFKCTCVCGCVYKCVCMHACECVECLHTSIYVSMWPLMSSEYHI